MSTELQGAGSPETLALELVNKGIYDERVVGAFRRIRRADFVPADRVSAAYLDGPIDIGHGQVTTQPSLIALMVQGLRLAGTERTLEIGTGLGFQTAVLSRLCQRVFSIERLAGLAAAAKRNLKKAGIRNVEVTIGDGTLGLADHAPFQAILVSAAAPEVPEHLARQLSENGRLVQPVGPGGNEIVTVFEKLGGTLIKKEEITMAYFVPLVGAFGARRE